MVEPPYSSATSSPPQPRHPDSSESGKLPSSQYKGVVSQPNRRWGAQIYEKHRRVWLGTFETEPEAALSYDIAVRKFRGRDAATNFAPAPDGPELEFILSRSKAEVVDMLRKHTYQDELDQSRRLRAASCKGEKRRRKEPMFEKAVTPSDVGKLNRLVIPKQCAEKHFPLGNGSSLLLSFEDECGKVWRFRYSYWNSSQSYVLTKGWSRFVKEKALRAGGVVVFGRLLGVEKQFYIECRCGGGGGGREKSLDEVEPAGVVARNVFRLFGVDYTLDASPVEFVNKGCVRAPYH